MRRAVRAIVIKDGQLLVVHRNKFGKEYDTLPGGRVEMNESLREALMRELDGETMVKVDNPRLLFVEHAGAPYGDQYIFICDYISGEPQLHPNSEELVINSLGENLYQPTWIKLEDVRHKPFVSEQLKHKLLGAIKSGWPEIPEEF
jgi:8-oxo-dGTP diphosphatase